MTLPIPPLKRPSLKLVFWTAVGAFAVLVAIAAFVFREDILKSTINPKTPFQAYRPPPAPDYNKRRPWALIPADPAHPGANDGVADIFFVPPTTYDGPREWNASVPNDQADHALDRLMLPNYAGPFARTGRVFAPHYRQAALYAFMSLRDDARDARVFAYGDVARAFRWYLDHAPHDRPLVIVGVEQGATLASRLVREAVAADPTLKSRLAAVYLIDEVIPRDDFAPGSALPACASRQQAGCVIGWVQAYEDDPGRAQRRLDRALVWNNAGELTNLAGRPALCVNPILGAQTEALAPTRLNLGAANATGIEWGSRPAFLPHQVSAQCQGGVLRVSRPAAPSFRPSGSWTDLKKAPAYNLFYRDLEADVQARVAALTGHSGIPAPPIDTSVFVRTVPKPHIGH